MGDGGRWSATHGHKIRVHSNDSDVDGMGSRHDDNKGSNDEMGWDRTQLCPFPQITLGDCICWVTRMYLVIHHPRVPGIAIKCLGTILKMGD